MLGRIVHSVYPEGVRGRASPRNTGVTALIRRGPIADGLLYDMSKFVCDQAASGNACWRKLPGPEDNVAANGVGKGIDGASRFGGTDVTVDANAAEIVAETRLKECARRVIQRLTRRTENLGHYRWGRVRYRHTNRSAL